MSNGTYAAYAKDLGAYKDMLAKVSQDLCSDEISIAGKDILCGVGKKLKKHIEYLQEVLAGATPPQD